MTDAQWLIITGVLLIVTTGVAAFVYALVSLWVIRPDVQGRIELQDARYKKLMEGMKRAGTWRSEYEVDSPPTLRIKDNSA